MDTTAQFIGYGQTGYFSKMVTDYIEADGSLAPFYTHPVSLEGIKSSIAQRKFFNTNRHLLVQIMAAQYKAANLHPKQKTYLGQLADENTFTICTAHQPNIFTGPLYFVYKILHAIKLAEELKAQLPENNFVPVYYMGSEDADLDELGHIFIKGEKFEWQTSQTGAVGRMKVDNALQQLTDSIGGQLLVYPFGEEIITLIKDCYQPGTTIEQATFTLVNHLFAAYGLLILLPDNSKVKRGFSHIIKKELTEGFSHIAVQQTVAALPEKYKAQASGREINLFYLTNDKRERIEKQGDRYTVVNTTLKFTLSEILMEADQHPERFSPNVILRPVLQETILPNIAFIGGGGEIAYWLQLKKVFEKAGVPYPMLVVRNSFMFISKELQGIIEKLQLKETALFKPELALLNELVKRDSTKQLTLEKEKATLTALYTGLEKIAGDVDVTLSAHTKALYTQALKKINALEKKVLSAEKKKFEVQQRQLKKLKQQLFTNNNLQERVSNLLPFYANWGNAFIQMLYENSTGLSQQFGIIKEQ